MSPYYVPRHVIQLRVLNLTKSLNLPLCDEIFSPLRLSQHQKLKECLRVQLVAHDSGIRVCLNALSSLS